MGHLQTAIAQATRTSAAGAARHHILNATIIQEMALRFYRDVLGFQPKMDVPMGEHRWLTQVSPDEPDGVQLLLEPDAHPAAKPFKAALMADGIPCTSFAVEDVGAEHARLLGLGVVLYPAAGRHGARHHGGFRRHLRQPRSDRPATLSERHGAGPKQA